jgi:hypothetical protein
MDPPVGEVIDLVPAGKGDEPGAPEASSESTWSDVAWALSPSFRDLAIAVYREAEAQGDPDWAHAMPEERAAAVAGHILTVAREAQALEAPELPDAAMDLLAEVRARLDAGLSEEQRQEIVHLLVRVVVHTETPAEGRRKTARATVENRFPAVVETSTGTRAGLNYTTVRRVIELPVGRHRIPTAPAMASVP